MGILLSAWHGVSNQYGAPSRLARATLEQKVRMNRGVVEGGTMRHDRRCAAPSALTAELSAQAQRGKSQWRAKEKPQ